MTRTKIAPRRQRRSDEARIFVPRPQGGPNITGRIRDRQLTDTIAKSTQLKIVNRTRKPQFKMKKLLPQRKTVQIKKNGQVVKTISVDRKSYYFNGNKAKQY